MQIKHEVSKKSFGVESLNSLSIYSFLHVLFWKSVVLLQIPVIMCKVLHLRVCELMSGSIPLRTGGPEIKNKLVMRNTIQVMDIIKRIIK